MKRVFTKNLGRWKSGDIRDYPAQTWDQIADSAKRDLESFTRFADEAATEMARKTLGDDERNGNVPCPKIKIPKPFKRRRRRRASV